MQAIHTCAVAAQRWERVAATKRHKNERQTGGYNENISFRATVKGGGLRYDHAAGNVRGRRRCHLTRGWHGRDRAYHRRFSIY